MCDKKEIENNLSGAFYRMAGAYEKSDLGTLVTAQFGSSLVPNPNVVALGASSFAHYFITAVEYARPDVCGDDIDNTVPLSVTWPEAGVFIYNDPTGKNRSVEYGVSPWYWYWTMGLAKTIGPLLVVLALAVAIAMYAR